MVKYVKLYSVMLIALVVLLVPIMELAHSAAASPAMVEYPLPTSGALPQGITSGPDGAIWFTELLSNNIGRISSSGSITEYPIPTSDSRPYDITSGPDNALWFTEKFGNKIGRISAAGVITEYPLPAAYSFPTNIIAGPDGALWFIVQTNINNTNGNSIARMTTSGVFSQYPVNPYSTDNTGIVDLTVGPDGAIWFTESSGSGPCNFRQHFINRISLSGDITYYQLPNGCTYPDYITAGPDGAFWFTEASQDNNYLIGRFMAPSNYTEYLIPTTASVPIGITNGPDGALWFTEDGSSQIGRIDTSGTIAEFPTPTPYAGPWGIVTGSDGSLWFTEGSSNGIGHVSLKPSAPTNLSAPSPVQNPSLTWDPVSGATSYNIYRNGTNIASSTSTMYTDNTAPEGTDSYYVTAVNNGSESDQSNTINVLVDRTAPTITYTVSPTPNASGWNNSPVTVTFNCSDNAGGSGIASCSSPQTESADGSYTLSGTATDNAENTSSVTAPVNLDQTPPTLGIPIWTNNPMTISQSTSVSVPVTDNLSGVVKGEYYLGPTDPGQGNGTAMTLSNGNLTASLSNQIPGIYTINVRAEDKAGNWSPITTDYLVVYDTTKTSADGHNGDLEPIYGADVLPGLLQSGQQDKAHFAFSVKYKNGQLDPNSTTHFDYKTGSNCTNPNKAINCHNTTLDASSITWMVINGTNNSVATIQGIATLTIDGTTTTNPFRIIATDGSLLNLQSSDQFELDIYAPNANPNTSQPLYHLSHDPLAQGNVVIKVQ